MTEATKALQGVDSGALAAQYRQCSAWAKGLKSMEVDTKASAFNMICPFLLVFVTSGYSQWNIDTGNLKASFAPQSGAAHGMKKKKI